MESEIDTLEKLKVYLKSEWESVKNKYKDNILNLKCQIELLIRTIDISDLNKITRKDVQLHNDYYDMWDRCCKLLDNH